MKKYILLDLTIDTKKQLSSDKYKAFVDDIIKVIEDHDFECAGSWRQMTEKDVLEE